MGIIPLYCPHEGCRLENAAYVVKSFNRPDPVVYECFSVCPGCGRSVIAVLNVPATIDPVNHGGNLLDTIAPAPRLHAVFPFVASVDTPDHVPPELHRFYEQAFDSLQRGNWDAASMMYRKTLERALKHLHPDGKGMLAQRIRELPDDLGVTDSMKEWAGEIKDIGNEAAHDDAETQEDAEAIYNFTNMFLRYTFTMPGMLKDRRNVHDDGEQNDQ